MIDSKPLTNSKLGGSHSVNVFLGACSILMIALSTVLIAVPPYAYAGEAKVKINIQRQLLVDSLLELGRQTELQFIYSTDLVQGYSTEAISGLMTPEEALNRLLSGTGIESSREGNTIKLWSIVQPTQLEPVLVVGSTGSFMQAYAGGQVATGGRVGMLGTKDFMDTPFSITSYTNDTAASLQAQNVSDVLIIDPSVGLETSTGHWLGNFNIRGFTVQSNDTTINGIGGLHPQNLQIPIEFVERIDVIRGPSAFLSGITPNGTIGGQINVDTKRAAIDPLTQLSLGYSSKSMFGTKVDIGRRWGDSNQWGMRINGSVENGNRVINGLSAKRYFGSIGLDYAGDRFRFGLDTYTLDEKSRGGVPLMARLDDASDVVPSAPNNNTNAFEGARHYAKANLILMQGEYDLNESWTIKAGIGRGVGKSYGFSTGNFIDSLDSDGNYIAQNWASPSRKESSVWFAGLHGSINTAAVSHELEVNFHRVSIDNFYHGASSPSWTGNIYKPSLPSYDAPTLGTPPKTAATVLSGVAIADTLGFLDDRLLVTFGARHQAVSVDNYKGVNGGKDTEYKASATTPMIAVVGKISPNWSIYANYAEGLSQGLTVGDTFLNAGEVFEPYKSKQYEAGVKWDSGSVANTLSVFQIKRPTGISDNSTSPLPTYRMDGEQRNRGVEWQFFGEPVNNFRVLGGVVYTKAQLIRTQSGLNDGNTAFGVPRWRGTMGLEYDVPNFGGLTLSARWTHAGSQYVNASNTMKLPSWNRFDVGARYSTKVSGRNMSLYFNVENITNRSYWESVTARSIILNSPRVFKLSATIEF